MDGFRHEAFLYAGEEEFLAGAASFIRGGLEGDEAIMVVTDARKLELLRAKLGGDADEVVFADMAEAGANPARLIPAWRRFLASETVKGRGVRGIGEPVSRDRGPAELSECHRHEALLNLAFADAGNVWFLCPYDTEALAPEVIEEAYHTHPYVLGGHGPRVSAAWSGPEGATVPFTEPLPDPAGTPRELHFDGDALPVLRRFVAGLASSAGLDADRVADLVMAANEVATNSVQHGGGRGLLRVWREPDRLICEVHDEGTIEDPLVGRALPDAEEFRGHGLWIANQTCDLLQVRSFSHGTVVRLHMRL
jgi:anti-sigma regulatory factor (Ser/Thr protein kinase)